MPFLLRFVCILQTHRLMSFKAKQTVVVLMLSCSSINKNTAAPASFQLSTVKLSAYICLLADSDGVAQRGPSISNDGV